MEPLVVAKLSLSDVSESPGCASYDFNQMKTTSDQSMKRNEYYIKQIRY